MLSVTGWQHKTFIEKNYIKKCYPKMIAGKTWSAIQSSTAAGLCAVVDLVLKNPQDYQGVVLQENISLKTFLENRFGQHYA
jgi:saccharopine dehydrogenase-like NADP-dependent oxidoreductase